MQSREFCEAVARHVGSTNRTEVDRILKGVIAVAKQLLAEGDEIRFTNFGRLRVVKTRGKYRVRFQPYVKYEQSFQEDFVEHRDARDLAH
jgi:nucleoid DNA-binding protein